MADFTFLPPAGSDPTAAYPSVLGKPAEGGPIVYPETQPNDPPAESDFTRETGLDPSKIPSLEKMLAKKRPPLRMLQGGAADSVDAGDMGPVANAESEKTGGAPKNALVITNTAQARAQVSATQQQDQTFPPVGTVPAAGQQPKAGMPWWQIALVAGGALIVGYSLAKRGSDSPLVADMDDEEGEEEDEG